MDLPSSLRLRGGEAQRFLSELFASVFNVAGSVTTWTSWYRSSTHNEASLCQIGLWWRVERGRGCRPGV